MLTFKNKFLEIKKWFNKQIEPLSFKQRFLLAILSLFLPIFLYGYWYFLPKYKNIRKLRVEITQLKEEISKYKKLSQQKTLLERKIEKRKIFLKEIIATLPSEKEIPELLSNVSEQAKRLGLEVLSFTPGKEITQDYYNIIPFDIETRGNFQRMVLFLDKVEHLTRIITLNRLSIDMKDKNDLVVRYVFHTYRYTGKVKKSTSRQKKK